MKKRIDWPFYRYVLALAVPIMLQNGITNFVGLLDNIMIGRIGTEQMSGVAIVNQLMFVVNLTMFGATAGPGIFMSQFHGSGNVESERQTFRYKLIACLAICVIGTVALLGLGDTLISAWLHDADSGDLALTKASAKEYLSVMVFGLLPFAVKEVYSSTLRETSETVVPMKAALIAVVVNLVLNYVLIFGKLGMPALGVRGAAIATVISRVSECAVVVVWTHRHADSHSKYIRGVYRSLYIRPQLAAEILRKGFPLILNEIFWSSSKAMLSRCYSERGLNTVAAFNISSAVNDVACVIYVALGAVTAIVLGNLLGAGKTEEARKAAPKLLVFSSMISACVGLLQVSFSGLFPHLYNTSDEIRNLAAQFILSFGLLQPIFSLSLSEYYVLRSGGTVVVTLLFDSVYEWVVAVPLAAALVFLTEMPIVWIYVLVNGAQISKAILGAVLVRKGHWVRNLAQQYQ